MISYFLVLLIILSSGLGLYLGYPTNYSQTTNALPSYVSVSIVVPPKNLELLQIYIQQHKVLNEDELYSLFIPSNKISQLVDLLKDNGIQPNVTLNVISFQASPYLVEKLFKGQYIITRFLGKTVYYFLSGSGIPGLVISSNITNTLVEKPMNMINLTQEQLQGYSISTPNDIRTAYNVSYLLDNGITGKGVNIGILVFDGNPYIQQELSTFDQLYNITSPPFLDIVPIGPYNPNDGIQSGWALEASLDVEYAHSIAPSAGIVLYVANSNLALPEILANIVQDNQVAVLSQSFGIPEIYFLTGELPLSYLQSIMYEYWLGEALGITFVASSGDAGATGYNFYLSPMGSQLVPASIPYVLAVGGTSLFASYNQTYQTAWSGQSILGSSTGGYSSLFPSPYYQSLSGFRKVPDVAALADPYTGVKVVYVNNETVIVGGTSVASPIVSGILALTVQVKGRLGFINPLIYNISNTPALGKISFGYNGGYTANSSYNLVTGLGYINAGYFIKLISIPKSSLALGLQNFTAVPGEKVKVIAQLTGVSGQQMPLDIYANVFNGTNIVSSITLSYNGSYYVGYFNYTRSGIYEIVASYNGLYGFSYVIYGYQAIFLFPLVAVYPIPGNIPVIALITYPNGTPISSARGFSLEVYNENQLTGHLAKAFTINLVNQKIVNTSQLGIRVNATENLLEGYLNFSSFNNFGGVWVLTVNNAIGLDEFVLGFYVIPILLPNTLAEPISAYVGGSLTLYIYELGLGYPNITVNFIKNGLTYYSTNVNAVPISSSSYYISKIQVPLNLSSGYYTVEAIAKYSNGSYSSFGVGYTQIYVSNNGLSVLSYVNSVAFENETIQVRALIQNSINDSKVTLGSFSAILTPSYSIGNPSSGIYYIVPLHFNGSYWIGDFTIPSQSSGLPYNLISGLWYVYIVGISADGSVVPVNTSVDYSTLEAFPSSSGLELTVMPYVYVKFFNGTNAVGLYIENAFFKNEHVVLMNSVVKNLTAINSSIVLINTEVYNLSLLNSKVFTYANVSTYQGQNLVTFTSAPLNNGSQTGISALTIEAIASIISLIPLIVLLVLERNKKI
ncbi:S53 family peptidase [Sulfolobus acidocaldarius]|uniref:Conserved Archaeal membrane protein n=4 Tax=Sulfolobus acidocaldarius TaxID=2285 RepID=Q4J6C8_SULAC|nr:S8 family serine peptidase [Sulfolobus acidocaldarius]AAY81652.1 conserved Archaeal membrane protein [Sulfolobus acidocaldarius DSM 639]AGE72255.1 hypothetical protein SacN8_11555 [Sulfolobus acidocaldarius N8]AGE74572.1 hypothetical protein SacRon12I_11800 [Sulfolobus acidocaldarius Ron12/I]ALU29584.1 hypothetical protein ATY89_06250 [Sulfolobus acidocaldarius]ALU32315.1 hypothetical protein ATZ20_09275 [Sulfolobus acidocaldarius]